METLTLYSSSSSSSLLSQHTHSGVAALRRHGGHDLPGVDDGVVALDAAEQRVPVVPGERRQDIFI